MAFVAEVSRYRKLFSISKEYAIRKAKWIVSTFLDVPPLTNDKSGEDQLALSAFATIKRLTGLVLDVLFMRWWLVKILSIVVRQYNMPLAMGIQQR